MERVEKKVFIRPRIINRRPYLSEEEKVNLLPDDVRKRMERERKRKEEEELFKQNKETEIQILSQYINENLENVEDSNALAFNILKGIEKLESSKVSKSVLKNRVNFYANIR